MLSWRRAQVDYLAGRGNNIYCACVQITQSSLRTLTFEVKLAMTNSLRQRSASSLEPAPNYLNLAYRGLKELPRESIPRLSSVEILDLSHNQFSYPSPLRIAEFTELQHRVLLYPRRPGARAIAIGYI